MVDYMVDIFDTLVAALWHPRDAYRVSAAVQSLVCVCACCIRVCCCQIDPVQG
jgi:hypothetical protein